MSSVRDTPRLHHNTQPHRALRITRTQYLGYIGWTKSQNTVAYANVIPSLYALNAATVAPIDGGFDVLAQ
eukprot:36883-Eustigmatos_ZCMA.PRE.1